MRGWTYLTGAIAAALVTVGCVTVPCEERSIYRKRATGCELTRVEQKALRENEARRAERQKLHELRRIRRALEQ